MTVIPTEDKVLTLAEAAAVLRISPSTAKKLAAKQELPGVLPKLGGQWRISERALLEYIRRPQGLDGGPSDIQKDTSNVAVTGE